MTDERQDVCLQKRNENVRIGRRQKGLTYRRRGWDGMELFQGEDARNGSCEHKEGEKLFICTSEGQLRNR